MCVCKLFLWNLIIALSINPSHPIHNAAVKRGGLEAVQVAGPAIPSLERKNSKTGTTASMQSQSLPMARSLPVT